MSDYDKYVLHPKGISEVTSRNDVNMKSDFFGLYPIISSPMKGISGYKLVIEMGKNNCFGILHRFEEDDVRKYNIYKVEKSGVNFGVAIGLRNFEEEIKIAEYAVERGASVICCDIANGYIRTLERIGKELKNRFGNEIHLMAGNVVSLEGADFLYNSGFDMVRIGIGVGSQCITRDVTGVSKNQLDALLECRESNALLVSDGGISKVGYAVKSFACGADFVMLGGILAYANEAENEGSIYGMASKTNIVNTRKELKSIEGIESIIDNNKKVPLKEIIDNFIWGTRSACTYLNCKSYTELQQQTVHLNS